MQQVATPVSWDAAYTMCRQVGYGWRMAEISSNATNSLLASWLSYNIPVFLWKNASGGFGNVRRSYPQYSVIPNYYSNWKTGEPTAAGTCAGMMATDNGKLSAIDCSTAAFQRVVCERDYWYFSGAATWSAQWNGGYGGKTSIVPFTLASLPSSTNDTLFGVTIAAVNRDCRPLDNFYYTASNVWISQLRQQGCMAMLIGENVSLSEFNTVVAATRYYMRHLDYRTSVHFTYVYWTNRYSHDMLMDFDTMHVYSSMPGTIMWEPAAGYAFYSAPSLCYENSMYPVEMQTELECREAERTLPGVDAGATYIGAVRPTAGADRSLKTDSSPHHPRIH